MHTSPRRPARHKQEHYSVLQVSRNATRQQIKAKFYELSRKHHPDLAGGDKDRFVEISEAHAVLSDEAKRKQYDRLLSSPQSGPGPGSSRNASAPQYDPLRRGPSSSQAYWSRQRPPPPPPTSRTGTGYNGYSPFGRRTPSGYGGPAFGSYGTAFDALGSRMRGTGASRRPNTASSFRTGWETPAGGGGPARTFVVFAVVAGLGVVINVATHLFDRSHPPPTASSPSPSSSSSSSSPSSSRTSDLSKRSPWWQHNQQPQAAEKEPVRERRVPDSLAPVHQFFQRSHALEKRRGPQPLGEIVPTLRERFARARRITPDEVVRYLEWARPDQPVREDRRAEIRQAWRVHLKDMGDEVARFETLMLERGRTSVDLGSVVALPSALRLASSNEDTGGDAAGGRGQGQEPPSPSGDGQAAVAASNAAQVASNRRVSPSNKV